MSQKPRRKFTAEQKAEAVRIVEESGQPISRVAKEMGLTESALRNWVKQSKIDCWQSPQGPLTSSEREELNTLRRELKRVHMERDFLTAVALSGGTPQTHCLKKVSTFFAKESSNPMS